MNDDVLPTGLAPDFLARVAEFMQSIPGGEMAFTIAAFVLVLGVLIFFHELGHFYAARSVGVRVQVFSIGFGRALTSWVDAHGTRWQVAWIPLGGYVQLLGMDGQALKKSELKQAFQSKPVWQRAWVIFAGPLANFVLAFALLVAVMLTGEHLLKAQVGEVQAGMPAYGVLQKNDLVLAANGTPVRDWDALQKMIQERAGQPTAFEIERGGQRLVVEITPQLTEFTDLLGDTHKVGRVGIAPSYQRFVVQHNPVDAVVLAAHKTWEITALTITSVYKLVIGAIAPDNLTGPLGIADMAGQTAAAGVFALLMLMVIISVNLGVVNLLPLPVLDGGHLVFLGYEALRGKAPSPVFMDYAGRVGLALIVCLALFATFNDVRRFGWVGGAPGEGGAAAAGSAATGGAPAAAP